MVTKINGTTGVDKVQNGVVTSSAFASGTTLDAYGFHAYRTSTVNVNNATIPWNATKIDTESGFNTSTGIYTIPKTGYWLFHLIITSATSQGAPLFSLNVNGVRVRDMIEGLSFGVNAERHASGIVYCTSGQAARIDVGIASFDVQGNSTGGEFHSSFMGFFIGN